jgi:Short C-terminal domain
VTLEQLAADIKHAIQIGDARRALARLERMRSLARKTQSEEDLRTVIASARELGNVLEGHDRTKALLASFEARQTLAQLKRVAPVASSKPMATGRRSDHADLAAQLKELASLHRVGALTDEEFQRAKQKLLA